MALVATRFYLERFLSMRKILTLCLVGTLMTGCESDFDKCMRTELPRAAADLGLDEARDNLSHLEAASVRAEYIAFADEQYSDWVSTNPKPSEPKQPSILDFDTTDEWIEAGRKYESIPAIASWRTKSDEALLSFLQEAGSDLAKIDEIEIWYEEFERLLMPRAMRNNCWGSEQCRSPLFAESYYLEKNSDEELEHDAYGGESVGAALSDSITWQKNRIAELEELAPETAIRACNANGFYE